MKSTPTNPQIIRHIPEDLKTAILGMASTDTPATLRTIKAGVQDKHRSLVEPAIRELTRAGTLVETKKHEYTKTMEGNH